MKSLRSIDSPVKPIRIASLVLGAVAVLCGATSLANAGSLPLPSGGHFVAGSGSISGSGTTLTIHQNASRGVIDWTSFSIGGGNHVDIENGSGATLNRVTGGDPSLIVGSLSATGSVYLINPQGIVVGPGGTVATGGRFVASTLDADNAAFMNGGPLTLTGTSNHKIFNFGKIGSSGGDVMVVSASEIDNYGSISAPHGTAELAAGRQVLLQDSTGSKQVFVQTGSAGIVRNLSAIEAAQISLQAADGNVYALSGNHELLRATGTATRDGHIWLVADIGTVGLQGAIEAKNRDGSGGTVDTSAGNLLLSQVTPTVSAGVWNITTPSFAIGDAAATSFSSSLEAGTSINLRTTGASARSGNIDVASNIAWNGAASLNLDAFHSVFIDKGVIRNQGSGNLTMRADATAIDNGGVVANFSTVDWSKSTGTVRALYDSSAVGGRYRPGTQLTNAAWTPGPNSGVRTQITAYQLVNTLAELQAINSNLSGNYALGRDIDASATSDGSFVPIGDGNNRFSGLFDGMGHRITSLTLVKTVPGAPQYFLPNAQGMFGANSGVVRDVSVSGSGGGGDESGAYGILVGDNFGTIENVSTSGSISATGWMAGGVVGDNFGNVTHASSGVNINAAGTLAVGGLVGRNESNGAINQSYAADALIAGGIYVGGLVGDNEGSIAQSFATNTVRSTESPSIGGLAGVNGGTITQSYATGSVYADGGAWIGGLVGQNQNTITQSFATGSVNSPSGFSGGIIGMNRSSIGNDVYWDVETSGTTTGVGFGNSPPSTNGLTTTQMSMPSSFSGYDFGTNGVWAMPAGATHPVLGWQVSSPGSR